MEGKNIGITVAVLAVLGGAGFGINKFNNYIDGEKAKADKVQVAVSYHGDLKKQAEERKNAPALTNQDIASEALLKASGLNGKQTSYTALGIDKDDGIFVKNGILEGDRIPYNSKLKSSKNDASLTDFDSQDEDYWKGVKKNDFNRIKGKVEKSVKEMNTEDNQRKEAQRIVQQAQQDERAKDKDKK